MLPTTTHRNLPDTRALRSSAKGISLAKDRYTIAEGNIRDVANNLGSPTAWDSAAARSCRPVLMKLADQLGTAAAAAEKASRAVYALADDIDARRPHREHLKGLVDTEICYATGPTIQQLATRTQFAQAEADISSRIALAAQRIREAAAMSEDYGQNINCLLYTSPSPRD